MKDESDCKRAFLEQYDDWGGEPGEVWEDAWKASREALPWPSDDEIKKQMKINTDSAFIHWLKQKVLGESDD